MKNSFKILLLGIFISACGISLHPKKDRAILKNEAKEFSLTIIKAYFQNDCGIVLNAMSDSIYIMDGDGVFSINGFESKLCRSISEAIRDKNKTYPEYLETYKRELLTRKEFEKRGFKLPAYFKKSKFDFFFFGFEFREGHEYSENFIWDDLFIFMVRKESKGWKIKAVSG